MQPISEAICICARGQAGAEGCPHHDKKRGYDPSPISPQKCQLHHQQGDQHDGRRESMASCGNLTKECRRNLLLTSGARDAQNKECPAMTYGLGRASQNLYVSAKTSKTSMAHMCAEWLLCTPSVHTTNPWQSRHDYIHNGVNRTELSHAAAVTNGSLC